MKVILIVSIFSIILTRYHECQTTTLPHTYDRWIVFPLETFTNFGRELSIFGLYITMYDDIDF